MKTRLLILLFLWLAIAGQTQALAQARCSWPRCQRAAVSRAPLLCQEHLQCHTTRAGEELRRLIESNDVDGVRRQAPIAGPDYFINGEPPIVHAVRSGHLEVVRALVAAGADAHWRTAMGESLVAFAVRENQPGMVDYFISVGAGTAADARQAGVDAAEVKLATKAVEAFATREMGFNPLTAFKMLEDAMNANAARQTEAPRENAAPPAPPSAGRRCTVVGIASGDRLKIRSGPGASYEPVASVGNGCDTIYITGERTMNRDTEWFPVRVEGFTGWACGKYLDPR